MRYRTHQGFVTAAKHLGISCEELRAHVEAGEKRCTRCLLWLQMDNYYPDPSRPDGRTTHCIGCCAERAVDQWMKRKGVKARAPAKTRYPTGTCSWCNLRNRRVVPFKDAHVCVDTCYFEAHQDSLNKGK